MWDELINNPLGTPQMPTDLPPVTDTNASSEVPVVSYNINCDNQPYEEHPIDNALQFFQPQPPVLPENLIQVNAEAAYNEDELFQMVYNKLVDKMKKDKDASSAETNE